MVMLSLLVLAFAVSIDGFGVGFTYGLRKMRIPLKSIFIIALCSAMSLIGAMALGQILEAFLSPYVAGKLGGFILIFLGGWILFQFFLQEKTTDPLPKEKTIINFEIKSLGIVINILKKPLSADFDRSGTITGIEAFMLGFALSLDAFGAGIGAAMLGFSSLPLAFSVAIMSSLFVFLGMKIGASLSHSLLIHKFSVIPGLLLILIGIWKM